MSSLEIKRTIHTSTSELAQLLDSSGLMVELLKDIGLWTNTMDASTFIKNYPEISNILELDVAEFDTITIEVD